MITLYITEEDRLPVCADPGSPHIWRDGSRDIDTLPDSWAPLVAVAARVRHVAYNLYVMKAPGLLRDLAGGQGNVCADERALALLVDEGGVRIPYKGVVSVADIVAALPPEPEIPATRPKWRHG